MRIGALLTIDDGKKAGTAGRIWEAADIQGKQETVMAQVADKMQPAKKLALWRKAAEETMLTTKKQKAYTKHTFNAEETTMQHNEGNFAEYLTKLYTLWDKNYYY